MNQPTFIETIKVKDGVFYNLPLHIARLERTAVHSFGIAPSLVLSDDMIPEALRKGLVKCRVVYSSQILSIEFEPYVFRRITSLTMVEDDNVNYALKYVDREALNRLYLQRKSADDVLIIKNGLVTDTSYANVVFENEYGLFTPQNCLLAGIKRQYLLENNIIKELSISKNDIFSFSRLYLINAMIDLEDEVCVSTLNVKIM